MLRFQIKATGFSVEEPLVLWTRTLGDSYAKSSVSVDEDNVVRIEGADLFVD